MSDEKEEIINKNIEQDKLNNLSSSFNTSDSFYQELKSQFSNIFTDSDHVYMDYVNKSSTKSNPPIIKLRIFSSNNRKRHHSNLSSSSSSTSDSHRNTNDKRYSDQYYRQTKRPHYHNSNYRGYNNHHSHSFSNKHDENNYKRSNDQSN